MVQKSFECSNLLAKSQDLIDMWVHAAAARISHTSLHSWSASKATCELTS